MGLSRDTITAIFREHAYRPIEGDVLLIGRQTVYLTPEETLDLMREHHILPPGDHDFSNVIDRTTISRREDQATDKELISDFAVFDLLGVKRVRALDYSDYEGAEIIHDLSEPLPVDLHGIADFIVDGSTLDNVFDPAMVIRNISNLLRPGGRLIMVNMLSDHHEPYALLTPLWYLDFFVMNGFVDCKVYITVFIPEEGDTTIRINTFIIDLDTLSGGSGAVSNFVSPHEMAVTVFAEKGPESTAHATPVQGHYRPAEQWQVYQGNLAVFQQNRRPHLLRSNGGLLHLDVRTGHCFVDRDFRAHPMTEFDRLVDLKPIGNSQPAPVEAELNQHQHRPQDTDQRRIVGESIWRYRNPRLKDTR